MKKTFTINISGIIFTIDEDAFVSLENYLNNVKRHLANTEGKEEIIADIESRVAELLQECLGSSRTVVSIDDVKDAIAVMGQPGDFDEDAEVPPPPLYNSTIYTGKRFYRDVDNKVLGGVCSGLANYFNIDPLWVRIGFIVLSMAWLTGVLIYLILWAILPPARTTAEKLEMKGEPVNASNIEKSIREELEHVKVKLNDLTDEARETFKKKGKQVKNNSDPVIRGLLQIGYVLVRIIAIVIGIAFLIISVSLIAALVGSVVGIGGLVLFNDVNMVLFPLHEFMSIVYGSDSAVPVIELTLMLLIIIPLFMLMVAGLRMIFNLPRAKYLGMLALSVWILSFILMTIFSVRILREFKTPESVGEKTILNNSFDTYYVELVTDQNIEDNYDYDAYFEVADWNMILLDDEQIFYGAPDLKIEKSNDPTLYLYQENMARGKNRKDARETAAGIGYEWIQKDSMIFFNNIFTLGEDELWRMQMVGLHLAIPEGKTVVFGPKTHRILRGYRLYPRWVMSDARFLMTEDGLEIVEEDVEEEEGEEEL